MGFPAHRLGQDETPKGSANPGEPGIPQGGYSPHPVQPQAPVAEVRSTLTPGPIVDETETFFR